MSSVAVIRTQVESRHPGAFTCYQRPAREVFPTGIEAVDAQTGGIPKGALTQICAPCGVSSGRATLLNSLLARVTAEGQFCALVDASDRFDPASAAAAGVCLPCLLWIRCAARSRMQALEQAFKTTDILLQNGGFGVIAVDLSGVDEASVRKIPLTTWFRFSRVLERTPTALVVMMAHAAAQSCAGLTLHLGHAQPRWEGQGTSHGRMLSVVEFASEIARTRGKKPVQKAGTRFTARPRWA
jgi:hypothetical protein